MLLTDVNVLLYAHRDDAVDHSDYEKWLFDVVTGTDPYGVSELVLSSFIRIATNPRAYKQPSSLEDALIFANQIRTGPAASILQPGDQHWTIFTDLCEQTQARGNLITDAYLAALAIEYDCEMISTDRDFDKFPGLRWRHPLE